jgi:hypothetical protein
MSSGRVEEFGGRHDVDATAFVDLGTVHDPSVIALGYLEADRVVIGRLVTFQGSRGEPVQVAAVEAALRDLCTRWSVRKIRIESWQGISSVQSLSRLGLPVELFAPTAKAHSEEWPVLAQRLSTRTLNLFPHARLREELLNLVYEVGPTGVKVIDRGRVHQDHAVAVCGVCAQLAQQRRPVKGLPAYMSSRGDDDDSRDHEGAVVASDGAPRRQRSGWPSGWRV